MAIPFVVDDVTKVDAAVQNLYSKNDADGKFYLQVEGVVAKEKVDEFRTKNIELLKQVEKFKDIDPGKYATFLDLEAKGKLAGKTPAEVDAIIAERITPMKTEYEGKIGDLSGKLETTTSQLSVLLVDNVIRDAASKAGITGAQMDDVLLRGKATFKLVDGQVTPHDSRGNVIYGSDATTPLSINDWLVKLKTSAPHLFPQSAGGNAPGNRGGGGGNPANMTAAQKITQGLKDAKANMGRG
jgi:hypothetical protein